MLRIVIDHDSDPDFSWLEQDIYDPQSPKYAGPVYPTVRDMRRKTNAYDPDWYRDPANHVALQAVAIWTDDDGKDEVIDSLGNIDFLESSDDWRTGTFYTLRQLKGCRYLQEIAREMGLRRQTRRRRPETR